MDHFHMYAAMNKRQIMYLLRLHLFYVWSKMCDVILQLKYRFLWEYIVVIFVKLLCRHRKHCNCECTYTTCLLKGEGHAKFNNYFFAYVNILFGKCN